MGRPVKLQTATQTITPARKHLKLTRPEDIAVPPRKRIAPQGEGESDEVYGARKQEADKAYRVKADRGRSLQLEQRKLARDRGILTQVSSAVDLVTGAAKVVNNVISWPDTVNAYNLQETLKQRQEVQNSFGVAAEKYKNGFLNDEGGLEVRGLTNAWQQDIMAQAAKIGAGITDPGQKEQYEKWVKEKIETTLPNVQFREAELLRGQVRTSALLSVSDWANNADGGKEARITGVTESLQSAYLAGAMTMEEMEQRLASATSKINVSDAVASSLETPNREVGATVPPGAGSTAGGVAATAATKETEVPEGAAAGVSAGKVDAEVKEKVEEKIETGAAAGGANLQMVLDIFKKDNRTAEEQRIVDEIVHSNNLDESLEEENLDKLITQRRTGGPKTK